MNSKQRVLATINFEKPDMVPIGLYENLVATKMMKKSFREIFLNGKLLAESRIHFHEEFGLDIIDVETGIVTMAEACGCSIEYPDDAAPWVKKPVLEELKDVSKLKIPNPYDSRCMYANLEAVNIISEKLGKDVFIVGDADQGPFSLAGILRGLEKFYIDLAYDDNYEVIHKLLEYTSKVWVDYAKAMIKAGADAVRMGESPAGPGLISPDQYKIFAQAYEKEITRKLKEEGIPVINHICGRVDKILDDFINTGADIIEIDEKTDLGLAKNKSIKRVTIKGAVSPNTLTFGSRDEIEEEVMKNIEIFMPGSGYILSPGCSIGASTPPGNIKLFIDLGRKYGRY